MGDNASLKDLSPESDLSVQVDHSRRLQRSFAVACDYATDEPIAKIAARYGMSAGGVCAIARRHGIRKRYSELDVERTEKTKELYRNGTLIKDITTQTKLDRKTIWRIIKIAGLPMRRVRIKDA